MDLVMSSAVIRQIEAEGVRVYPNECCGIMIGREEAGRRIVERLIVVENQFEEGEQYHRFLITPDDLMKAERQAGAGKLVLGFYHSHPDHPSRPSQYDLDHSWPFYSYVIVAIEQRVPRDTTSWMIDEATETFRRQEIVIEGG